MARINDTTSFYAGDGPPSLFWELTICQSLADPQSPYQVALRDPRRYGEILARFLVRTLGLDPDWSVVEVGGGYGSLMGAFLDVAPLRDLTMVDISPFFTARQRELLGRRGAFRFVTADALTYFPDAERPVDLVISNENIGDFPTVTGIRKDELEAALADGGAGGPLREVAEVVAAYDLDLSAAPTVFHFNLGAIRYLEALAPVARRVFLSEHSCDPVLPSEYRFLPLPAGDGYPREIPLKGHSEYSIHFGHLARVAERLGYRVTRLHLAELVGLRIDEGLQAMARVRSTASETAEMVHEFCEHVAEYQCMVLSCELEPRTQNPRPANPFRRGPKRWTRCAIRLPTPSSSCPSGSPAHRSSNCVS